MIDPNPRNESVVTDMTHPFTARKPDFTPVWDRNEVIPDNVLLPGEVKAEMRVDSRYPESRPRAEIEVSQEWDKAAVPEVRLPPLKLSANKVVDSPGARPSHKFTLKNKIWEKYNKLLYHFQCKIDQTTKKTTRALKVKRWHVQALDTSDSSRPAPNIYTRYRTTERSNFLDAFQGRADDKAHAWDFNAGSTSFATFGEKMKNTYTFVYTGHGAVMCRTCQAMFTSITTGSDADYGRWTRCSTPQCNGSPRSTHCIGGWQAAPNPSFMDGSHIADSGICPTTPKYLMFSVCCGGAFETSLYDAYIGRDTKYCVGFKKSTRCDWARDYAKSFFDTWVTTHDCNPDKIPDVFKGLQATWETKLQPSLFGKCWGAGSHIRNLGRRIASLF
jgi:hypothetical protein